MKHSDIKPNPDEAIPTVMAAMHEMTQRLVSEGILSNADLNDATGEASCVEIQFAPASVPFYIQPMVFEDEPDSVDLYVECTAIQWEPAGFSVEIGDRTAMEMCLMELRDFLVAMAPDHANPAMAVPQAG